MLFFVYMDKPSQTINLIWKNFLSDGSILDLGCGQGRDSLFLAKNNFLSYIDHFYWVLLYISYLFLLAPPVYSL